jgi:transcription antitermination factor NusG
VKIIPLYILVYMKSENIVANIQRIMGVLLFHPQQSRPIEKEFYQSTIEGIVPSIKHWR